MLERSPHADPTHTHTSTKKKKYQNYHLKNWTFTAASFSFNYTKLNDYEMMMRTWHLEKLWMWIDCAMSTAIIILLGQTEMRGFAVLRNHLCNTRLWFFGYCGAMRWASIHTCSKRNWEQSKEKWRKCPGSSSSFIQPDFTSLPIKIEALNAVVAALIMASSLSLCMGPGRASAITLRQSTTRRFQTV